VSVPNKPVLLTVASLPRQTGQLSFAISAEGWVL
jgi:hypothetical protein